MRVGSAVHSFERPGVIECVVGLASCDRLAPLWEEPRVKRRYAVVTLAALVAVGLGGCQIEPGAAAFVSNDRITDKRVDQVVNSISTDKVKLPANRVGDARQFVVNQLVFGEVAKRIVAEKKLPVTPMSPEDAAAQRQATQPGEIDRIYADTQPYLDAVRQAAAPAEPTEADKRELATVLLGAGATQSDVSRFLDSPQFKQSLGFRNALRDGAAKYKVSVSPRYAPARYEVWSVQGLPLLTLDLASPREPAVTDRPAAPEGSPTP
jgi:hypothetical protein